MPEKKQDKLVKVSFIIFESQKEYIGSIAKKMEIPNVSAAARQVIKEHKANSKQRGK